MVTDGVSADLCALAGIRHYRLCELSKAIADAMSDYDKPRILLMPHAAETVIRRKRR
jgi:hypothetical protein